MTLKAPIQSRPQLPAVESPIDVVETDAQARDLLRRLQGMPGPFGLDCETVGVDPSEESPVGRGSVVCWSISWPDASVGRSRHDTPLAGRAFLWASTLPVFRDWLADPAVGKVGHSIWGFDRHVLRNDGFKLEGITADTLRLGRLCNASAKADHSLKGALSREFGYDVHKFSELFSRRVCLGEEDLGETKYRKRTVCGVRLSALVGGASSRIGSNWELLDLRSISSQYPERLGKLYQYGSLDAKGTLEYYFLLRKHAEQTPWRGLGAKRPWGSLWEFYERCWNPFLSVLWDLERAGIRFEPGLVKEGRELCAANCERLLGLLQDWAGPEFNPGSGPQLTQWLYDALGWPVPPVTGSRTALKKTPSGKQPTTEASLLWLKTQGYGSGGELENLAAWKKETRQLQFLDKLPEHLSSDGRIHSVLQPEADTGRLTSKNPNLQQIPKHYDPYHLRKAFIPAPGCKFIVSDYSQLELFILAHFLIELFDDHSMADAVLSSDAHAATAAKLGVDRATAKSLNFGINYGKSAVGLGLALGVPTEKAQEYLNRYLKGYPGIKKFHEYCFEQACTTGVVRTLMGRTRPLPAARSDNHRESQAAYRQACNTPIQGSAADVVVSAMIKLSTALPYPARMVLQVHDELIVECPEDIAEEVLATVIRCMEHPFNTSMLRVPLRVDARISDSW